MHRVLEYKIKNIVYCWLRKEVDKYCTYCTSRLSVSLAFCNAFFLFKSLVCLCGLSQIASLSKDQRIKKIPTLIDRIRKKTHLRW